MSESSGKGQIKTLWELCSQRAADKSQLNKRLDTAHIALVIEGGGMRGVVTGGMVSELQDLGWGDVFDSIHGSSAGACAAAYFAAKQSEFGTSIYYEDINNKNFINKLRLKKVMDADYCVAIDEAENRLHVQKAVMSHLIDVNSGIE